MLHVVMSTDSLSLPRPWFQNNPAEMPERFTRLRQTYPLLLESALRAQFPESEVRITNLAVRASSLASSFSHRLELFSWMEADAAVLHKGVVDCWPREALKGMPNTTLSAFRDSMNRLLDERARIAPNHPFIVVGISPANGATMAKNPKIAENISAYNAILSAHSDANTRFIDMEKALRLCADDVLHPDGHHLTAAGHAILAGLLAQAITELLTPSWRDREGQ
ncbi:SGNH/GDSL hydrolase family protein [Falsiroseomonas sp.]|uniref:SGNH/GDSL hydrolase family protein n=1 Tax=Falsiroseomonas sp. TaxID=2870721 RepID=UPI0034A0FB4A